MSDVQIAEVDDQFISPLAKIKFQRNEKLRRIGLPNGVDHINGLPQSGTSSSKSGLKLEIDLLSKRCVSLTSVLNQKSYAI